jgi:hypothetical protein
MNTKLLQLIGATALLFSTSGVAVASTVGFNPSRIDVLPGDTITVDIVGIDFIDPLAGGTFDLGFDSAHLQINSVTINTTTYEFLPDGGGLLSPGVWGTVGFDTFGVAPTGDITIALLNLTVLSAGTSNVIIQSSAFFDDVATQLDPTLTPLVVGSVPVPAAVWLFGSGLLGLIGVARRKTA